MVCGALGAPHGFLAHPPPLDGLWSAVRVDAGLGIHLPGRRELAALSQSGTALGDVYGDGAENGRELIGDASSPAVYVCAVYVDNDGTGGFVLGTGPSAVDATAKAPTLWSSSARW